MSRIVVCDCGLYKGGSRVVRESDLLRNRRVVLNLCV
jgi:hypothetical protein